MSKFKVGDWVTHGRDLHRVTDEKDGMVKVTGLGLLSDSFINSSKFVLWHPQVGELTCWYNYFRRDNTIYHVGYLTQDILDSYDHVVPVEFIQTLRG